ncbi:unnamed protein product [Brassica oleracea var. botrytis]
MFLCLSLVIFLSHKTHLRKAGSSNHGWRRRRTTTTLLLSLSLSLSLSLNLILFVLFVGSIQHMRGWRK